MILVDTTILVYAVGADHPLREPCRALVAAIGEGRQAATTTVEVLQEFTHVRSRRRSRQDAADLAEHYAALLSPLVEVGAADLAAGLQIYRSAPDLGCFDAVLAAVALRRDHITALVSADQAFAAVPGLRHIDPADPGETF
ncbi:MAG: type II toxin-antitoxin system VapC family toxin [Bifidobacteriaceae bacterium]|jgi:predicted nucleic acid-binding protein|nr:type II toxin-antitoxin system VapC family toxin [Bifidobacteriaceae bacterium]